MFEIFCSAEDLISAHTIGNQVEYKCHAVILTLILGQQLVILSSLSTYLIAKINIVWLGC